MRTLSLSHFLKARRVGRGLSQAEVAHAIGVARVTVTRYESGLREVPHALLPALATVLEVDCAHLEGLRHGVTRAAVARVGERAPLTPLEGRVSDVLRLPAMQACHDAVRECIGDGAYAEMDAALLRQTPYETALALRAIENGARPVWTSALEAGSRVLVVGDDKRAYEGHLLRLGLLWERGGERLVLLPQVPVLVPRIDKRYRVDYLALHATRREPVSQVAVELDGVSHDQRQAHDELRAEDLRLPLARFDNGSVSRPDFWPRLLDAVREKAAAARISNGEYARFLRVRRGRYGRQQS